MSAIGSVLKKVIKELPETFVSKAESVAPMLLKKGVKAEELKFSELAIPKTGKVTKQALVEAESKRADKFYTTANTEKYRSTSIDANKYHNPTYREKILKFKRADGGEIDVPTSIGNSADISRAEELMALASDMTDAEYAEADALITRLGIDAETTPEGLQAVIDGEVGLPAGSSRYTSTHFQGEPDYLMHTRVYDDNIDGVSTRVVSEIQSDLHQAGRQSGYDKTPNIEALKEINEALDKNVSIEELNILADKHGLPTNIDIEEWASGEIDQVGVPTSPFEKTWLKKGIEREIVDAINDGKTQLAIPISGNVNELSRAAGVQKWYETQVVNTAKKLAKQSGGTFEMKTIGDRPSGVLSGGYKPDYKGLKDYVKSLTTEIDEEGASAEYIRDKIMDEGISREAASNISMNLHEDYTDEAISLLGNELNIITEDLNVSIKELSNLTNDDNLDFIATKISTNYNVDRTEAFSIASQINDGNLDTAKSKLENLIRNKKTNTVDYAVIKLNPEAKGFSLYSSPIAGAFVAYQAYQAGMSTEEINKKLAEDYDYDEEDLAEINTRVEIISQAKEAGMSEEEIKKKMEGREISADTEYAEPPKLDQLGDAYKLDVIPTHKQLKIHEINNLDEDMTAEDLVSSMRVIHPTMVSDTITTIPAFFGNKAAQQRYDQARESSRTRIISLAKENYGLDLVWQANGVGSESFFAQTPEGLVEVNQSFWEDIKKNSGEIVGGVGGAIAGAKLAGAATPPVLPLVGPLAKPIMSIVGAAAGGWLGAVAGSQADYMNEAIRLQEDMEMEAMAYKGLNAFEAAAIGEIIGYPIAKGLGAGWKGIMSAKDAIIGGETRAAYKALKDSTFLNDSQIDAIVAQLEKHSKLKGNKYEKGIQAVALTEPGMQDLVRAAGATKPKVSSATAYTVSKRAEEVLAQTANLTDEQVPRLLVKDLQNYVTDVKDSYRTVKAEATQSPRGLNFGWDYEDLAVYPVLEDLMAKITDPATKEKFILQMQRVGNMSESRTYGDLIELRQITNDFLYNKRVTKADDMKTLRKVIGNIDEAIEDGAQYVFDDPAKWLEDWSKVRMDYSKMKQVEKTTMYRTMFNRDGSMRAVQPKVVVKALGKHITSIDGSFEDIMSKLPIEGRKMYEGAVVDLLANQFTAGIEKGTKAIHFPMLAEELRKINFTTPDARATKKALIELGETFKNDVYLAQTANQISIPKFQSYLTTDPVVRAKFEVASGIFNYIKSKAPGDSNRQLALVRATSKLLEKPLDTKNFKALQEELFDNANLSKQVLELQQLAASNRMKEIDVGTPKIKIYKGGKFKGTGTSSEIPMHRIATLKQAKEIAETEAITLDNKSLDSILRKYGYEAVLQGSDRVRILGGK